MTQQDIYKCFGINTSAPDYDIETEEDILNFIKVCIATTELFKDMRLYRELEKIRAEIDSYCSDNRDRNDGLYIAMKIIDKHIGEYTK